MQLDWHHHLPNTQLRPVTAVSHTYFAGTPIRDYIHVVDVARGHLDALTWMTKQMAGGSETKVFERFNFGTGRGTTVFELIAALEKASGKTVPYVVGPARDGDLLESYCDPAKAASVLGWRAIYSLDRMCEDAWRWQSNNPQGYDTVAKADPGSTAPAVAGSLTCD